MLKNTQIVNTVLFRIKVFQEVPGWFYDALKEGFLIEAK